MGKVVFEDDDDETTSGGDGFLRVDAQDVTVADVTSHDDDRDEVVEIQKLFDADTKRVRRCRFIVTLCLTVTGILVSVSSFRLLVEQEEKNFDDAYDQFADTVADAAVDAYVRAFEAVRIYATQVSKDAYTRNVTWPFYDALPTAIFAQEQSETKNLESLNLLTRVFHRDREVFATEFNANIIEEWVKDGHIRAWGHLDELVQSGYQNDIIALTSEGVGPSRVREEYWPLTYRYPPPFSYFNIGLDINSFGYDDLLNAMIQLGNQTLISNVNPYVEAGEAEERNHAKFHSALPDSLPSHPHSFIFHPVHAIPEDPSSEVVAAIDLTFPWDAGLRNLLPDNLGGLFAVTRNNCNQSFTYIMDGVDAFYQGEGDRHDRNYDHKEVVVDLDFHQHEDFFDFPGHCVYQLSIYPSNDFREDYVTNIPQIFVILISMTFFIMVIVFYVYDFSVQKRNQKIISNAARSNEIVTSVFPDFLQEQIYQQRRASVRGQLHYTKEEIAAMLEGSGPIAGKVGYDTAPIAEYYKETTLMFADLVGFTSWSSQRQPEQVFKLLETCYHSFDEIARQRHVFKVETVGDCYVAVTGFPNYQSDHAVRMCRFAKDISIVFERLIRELETELGPDTGNLGLRVGIHSGPVTGGVIRGDRARFQLFGDSMNTCARIETNGEGGRLHLSSETAQLLIMADKSDWLEKRSDLIPAKGKGYLQTYWCNPKRSAVAATITRAVGVEQHYDTVRSSSDFSATNVRTLKFIDWNVNALADLLKRVVARRQAQNIEVDDFHENDVVEVDHTTCFLDEFEDAIPFQWSKSPMFEVMSKNSSAPELMHGSAVPELRSRHSSAPDLGPMVSSNGATSTELSSEVMEQLRYFLTSLASTYNPNPFHNFEHASYVVQSVVKTLDSLIAASTAPTLGGIPENDMTNPVSMALALDPLFHFGCALAALFQGAAHPGLSDDQFAKESPVLANRYRNNLVREQNSLDIAWKLFMDPDFEVLRQTIYTTADEMKRFRAVVVKCCLATVSIEEQVLGDRQQRWEDAFGTSDSIANNVDRNLQASAIAEHLMVLCYVSPMVHSWHIYQKWNKILFKEHFQAWEMGRAASDPAAYWAEAGVKLFDSNAIDSAQKLVETGVLGLAGEVFLEAAKKNRKQWVEKGPSLVSQAVQELMEKSMTPSRSTRSAISRVSSMEEDDIVDTSDLGREWMERGDAILARMVDQVNR